MLPDGIEPVIWPLTKIRRTVSEINIPPDSDAVVFTSANGAEALAALTSERSLPVLVVGDRTAKRLRELGFSDVRSASGDIHALRELILASGVSRVFHAHGRDVTGDLAADLAPHGISVASLAVYAAVEAPADSDALNAIRSGEIALVTVWSRRNAVILARHMAATCEETEITSTLLGLSENVVAPLKSSGFCRKLVASAPNGAAMLSEIKTFFAALRQ